MANIAQGTELSPEVRTLGNLQLFLYSASVQIPHRIHYDYKYAQEEGHPDVLVHGPFQTVCMVQQVIAGLGDGWRVTEISYRHLRAVLVDQPFECAATVVSTSDDGTEARIEIVSRDPNDVDVIYTRGQLTARRDLR